jgi:tetratricopeptide (TPR) repeat protein
MSSCPGFTQRPNRLGVGLAVVLGFSIAACTEVPRSSLPPSATDLTLLTSTRLCDEKAAFLEKQKGAAIRREAWGSGEELRVSQKRAESGAEESFFFDEDGLLVGALFTFPAGLSLKPYPVLRRTLSELKPTVEFYLTGASLPGRANLDSSTLYMTGDEKSTTQYITLGGADDPALLLASFSVDPYSTLLSPYRQEFLSRIGRGQKGKNPPTSDGRGPESKEPFSSLQAFARGQTAQLAYCGSRNYDRAVDAYRKAIAGGFTDKVWMAEAHHRLGLALEGQGRLEEAKVEMQQSLEIHPNTPEVLNNLGTVFTKLGDRGNAMKVLEKAVTLRPNYHIARYNLAEAYESVNAKRSISEYETYLALVQGVPEEAARAAQARERIKALRR